MALQHRKTKVVPVNTYCFNNAEIWIYIRPSKLLQPVPYKIEKINISNLKKLIHEHCKNQKSKN